MRWWCLVVACALAPAAVAAPRCTPAKPESFDAFFPRFTTQLGFSNQRMVVPLRFLRWQYGISADGVDESGTELRWLDPQSAHLTEPLQTYAQKNKLIFRTQPSAGNTRLVELFLPDSDWLVVYHFKRRAGCWYLWQIEDQSL